MNVKRNTLTLFLVTLVAISTNIFIVNTVVNLSYAGSSSSGDIPPPGGEGGEDTGGGSAAGGLYLNYRIPLIFTSGPFGPSLIAISFMPLFSNETTVLFDFESPIYGNNATILYNETLILDPSLEPELKNGSLIQAFEPLQITVYHQSSNEEFDDSYSYSVLVMQNWGRKYLSSFDNMRAKIVAGFNDTEYTITSPDGSTENDILYLIGDTVDVEVSKGTIIEANGPIGVVFYSLSTNNGAFAFTGVPFYLWGETYYLLPPPTTFDIPSLVDNSAVNIGNINEDATLLTYTFGGESEFLFTDANESLTLRNQDLEIGSFYRNITSIYNSNFSVSVMYNYEINNTIHRAAVQYIAAEKMRWGEWFWADQFYSNGELNAVSLFDGNTIIPLIKDPELGFIIDAGSIGEIAKGSYFRYQDTYGYGFGALNGSSFVAQDSSAPEASNWNSSANLLFPMNLYSFFDSSNTSFPSWYRFPNINVKEVEISPSTPTGLRNLKLDIGIQNNGTIPSAPFWVAVYVNETIKINKKLDGLDINDTFIIEYEEFQGFGIKTLNVSIYTDYQNNIFELAEYDNSLEVFIQIERNWNIIYVGIGTGVLVISGVVFYLTRKIIKKSKERRTKFDLILSDVEV